MSIHILSRYCVAIVVVTLLFGCSSNSPKKSVNPSVGTPLSDLAESLGEVKCKLNRSSCMYEGQYDSEERGYAEQEARNLNKAAMEKFRRDSLK